MKSTIDKFTDNVFANRIRKFRKKKFEIIFFFESEIEKKEK